MWPRPVAILKNSALFGCVFALRNALRIPRRGDDASAIAFDNEQGEEKP